MVLSGMVLLISQSLDFRTFSIILPSACINHSTISLTFINLRLSGFEWLLCVRWHFVLFRVHTQETLQIKGTNSLASTGVGFHNDDHGCNCEWNRRMNANDYFDEVNIAIIHSYRKTGITFHKYIRVHKYCGDNKRGRLLWIVGDAKCQSVEKANCN